jgi:hypothetical protein
VSPATQVFSCADGATEVPRVLAAICDTVPVMRWLVLLLAGCSSILGIDDFRLGDAGVGGEFCAGPDGWKICLAATPEETYLLSSALNLRTGDVAGNGANAECLKTIPTSWTLGAQSPACIIVASDVLIKADILVSGQRPLVIVASKSITIEGLLDVGSHGPSTRGAASPSSECKTPSPSAGDSSTGASGGSGGSFISTGGNGGRGSANLSGGVAASADAKPTTLRAGCNGEEGGLGTTTTAASGGAGGGAVYLVASDTINLAAGGGITANGAGGQGGQSLAGGGGGGSGGMIVLHAKTITGTNGTLTASGGGGGGAGNSASFGMAGKDPQPKNPSDTALGGLGASGAGAGGNGFSATTAVGNGRDVTVGSSGGGGGGGGGSGLIMANVAPTGVTTSPDRSGF